MVAGGWPRQRERERQPRKKTDDRREGEGNRRRLHNNLLSRLNQVGSIRTRDDQKATDLIQHSTIHIEPLENGQPPVGKHVLVTLLCPVTARKKQFGLTPEDYSSETISASAERTTQTTEGSAAAGGSAAAEQQQATTHKQK